MTFPNETTQVDNAQDADSSSEVESTSSDETSEENTELAEGSDESQDQDSEKETDEDSESEEKAPKDESKHRNGFKKRLDREKRKLSEAQREADYWKKVALEHGSQPKQTEQAKTENQDPEPNMNDFDTVGEYNKALVKWELRQSKAAEKAEREKEQSQIKAKETYQKVESEFAKKLDTFKKAAPDFDDVVEDFNDRYGKFKASLSITEAILSSEFGPQIYYDILKTPGEYERLSGMSEVAIIRELGKKEARLASEASSSRQIKTSKAPAPVSTIGKGSASTSKSLSDPKLSFAEFERMRMKQLNQK